MDYYNASGDWGVLGLSSPILSECTLDFSSPSCILSSFEIFKELNDNHGKKDAFADWMDEKIDLSILDELEGQPDVLDDLDVMNGDQAALLDNWIDWSLLGNGSGPTETKKNDFEQDMLQGTSLSPPVSPGNKVPDISFAVLPEFRQESLYQKTPNSSVVEVTITPDIKVEEFEEVFPGKVASQYVKIEANSPDSTIDRFISNTPPFTPPSSVTSANEYLIIDTSSDTADLDSCVSSTPVSLVSSVEFEGTENAMEVETVPEEMPHPFSPFMSNSSFTDKSSNNESQELPGVPVSKCNSGNTSLLIESETNRKSNSRKKKYQSHKKAVPVVNSLVPVEVRRKERKRVQNKDAATRYRDKKRKEYKAIVNEEQALEKRNRELHDKVNKLSNEISYLKGLLNEAKLRAQARKKLSPKFTSPVAM